MGDRDVTAPRRMIQAQELRVEGLRKTARLKRGYPLLSDYSTGGPALLEREPPVSKRSMRTTGSIVRQLAITRKIAES